MNELTDSALGIFVLLLASVLWIYMVFLPARMAKEKGHSFFITSIPFWWVTLFVVLLFLDDRTLAKKYEGTE